MTEEKIGEYFRESGHVFLLWDESFDSPLSDLNIPVEYMSLFICLSGEIDFVVGGKPYHADPEHIQFFMKNPDVCITDVTQGYHSVGIIFSKKHWTETLMHLNPFTSLSLMNPCLEITPQHRSELLEFLDIIKFAKSSGKPDENPVVKHLVYGLLYHLGNLYEAWSKTFPQFPDRLTFVEFTRLLFKHYKEHRDVAFYAEEMGLTTERFSDILRKSVGYPAKYCIERYVIIEICKELNNTDKSIKEIAVDFNFNDTSHFCKFFRKQMNESPETYRTSAIRYYP